MFVSTANTIALAPDEVHAARAVRVPLAEIPQKQKGNLRELQFRNVKERDEWAEILGNAFDEYLHSAVTGIPALATLSAPLPTPPQTKTSQIVLYTLLWASIIVAGILVLVRYLAR